MAGMLNGANRPQFDFCFLDAGHTWDVTGFAFLLVDMLLKPGGMIVLDDLDWTIAKASEGRPERAKLFTRHSQEEKDAKGVLMVLDLIAPHLGYVAKRDGVVKTWGVARKPSRQAARGRPAGA